MANEQIKISELTEVTSVTGNEEIPVVQSGSTKKMSLDQAKDFIGGAGVIIFPEDILELKQDSTSDEIFTAFGGKTNYNNTISKIKTESLIKIGDGPLYSISLVVGASYTDENNSQVVIQSLSLNVSFYLQVTVTNGTAKALVAKYTFVDAVNVLQKNNTDAFTPTQPYHPATKKYVDDQMYLLTISNAGHQELISNQETADETVVTKINTVFGSADNFKNVVSQLIANKRLVIKITETERFQPGVIHSYMNTDNRAYELSFDYNYSDLASDKLTLLSKRIFIALNDTHGNYFIVRDIVVSDNLTTITKKTAAEYEALGSKDANTAYCVTD